MLDILKITIVFILIVWLLRRKWNIGLVMLAGSGLLAALYLMRPADIWATALETVKSRVTITLLVALTFIRAFEIILRKQDIMTRMMEASRAILRRRRAVIVSMPLLIGMLPSVGGAYFSAPMVDESTRDLELGQEEKSFINFWYRHPWEYVLPLYPGLVLATALTGLGMQELIVSNLPYALAVVLGGYIFGLRKTAGGREANPPAVSKGGLRSFGPIAMVLLLVVVFGIPLHYALIFSVLVLLLYYRPGWARVKEVTFHAVSRDVLVLIFGVMFFKEIMEASGAVENISGFFSEEGIPLLPMLFLLPFIAGLLTGLTVGFVGSTFPLLISFMGGAPLPEISFAFACGFVGVLLSPVHVCLVLTREYFKANMGGVYMRLIPASLIIIVVALVEFFLLKHMGI